MTALRLFRPRDVRFSMEWDFGSRQARGSLTAVLDRSVLAAIPQSNCG
jgi:hypothetical protein